MQPQDKEGILPVVTLMWGDPIDGSEAEVYIFRSRGVFIDVYKADEKIATSGATSLADIEYVIRLLSAYGISK